VQENEILLRKEKRKINKDKRKKRIYPQNKKISVNSFGEIELKYENPVH